MVLSPSEQPLWPGAAPGALGNQPADIPSITAYLPARGMETGASIVILPGGGYGHLAVHEGAGYAEWLAQHGITAFVVKYRLGSNAYRHPAMLHDAARAVRMVRANAAHWGLDPARIGIMGSSAGGHLAATLLTHFDAGQAASEDPVERVSSRPDLGILCYPVISMGPVGHDGCRRNLLGDEPAPELVEFLSNEKQVTCDTPSCFLFHTWEDAAVKVENALLFAQALREKGVPFDLHIYENGRHGVGLWENIYAPGEKHPWTRDLLFWLKERKFA